MEFSGRVSSRAGLEPPQRMHFWSVTLLYIGTKISKARPEPPRCESSHPSPAWKCVALSFCLTSQCPPIAPRTTSIQSNYGENLGCSIRYFQPLWAVALQSFLAGKPIFRPRNCPSQRRNRVFEEGHINKCLWVSKTRSRGELNYNSITTV